MTENSSAYEPMTAEAIISDWVHSKCNPSPYDPGQVLRRVTQKAATAFKAITEAIEEVHRSAWEAFTDIEGGTAK